MKKNQWELGKHTVHSKAILSAALFLIFAGCAPQKFENVDGSNLEGVQDSTNNEILSNFFKVSDSQTSFSQENLEDNKTTVTFKAQLTDGSYLNSVTSQDVSITENNVPVSHFSLSSNSQNIVQTVDIVFAVDITGSMGSTIESAKTRLTNFVYKTRNAGFHTRMCLVTFGDYTVQKCNKFYDNNPEDPATAAQVTELVSEISKLRAYKGSEDPGGSDYNENPMRALIDSASAPWGESSQRFMILITDDGFLYSPGNSGSVGALAPKWTEVMAAIQNSQMKVFAVAPDNAGYRLKFQGQPSIVTASSGEFFLFKDLISGKITLDTILNRIISTVRTTYTISYSTDENSGLNGSLALKDRKITVQLRSGLNATVAAQTAQSNLPDGRSAYKKSFKLSDKQIKSDSVIVKVNGVVINSGYTINNGQLVFDQAPPKGATIEVRYGYATLKDSVQLQPALISGSLDVSLLSVFFNGIKARSSDVVFEKTIEGHWSVRPSDNVFTENDPFRIRANGGLSIRVRKTALKTNGLDLSSSKVQ